MTMSSRALAWFFATLLVFSWGVQIAALVLVGDPQASAMTPWLIAMMFIPTLWSAGYLTIFNRSAWKRVRFWPGNPIYLVLAALIPALIGFAMIAVFAFNHWGVSSFFTFNADGATIAHGPWLLGRGAQSWPLLAGNVAVTAIAFAAFNGLAAVGEEFGWRGVLQQHVIERFGFVRGVALLGFVWAIWHAPMNLAGYNVPQAPVLGAFVLFPIQLIAVSFIMAWLTLRARSFWPAVLMHGSGNGIEEGVKQSLTLATGVPPLTAELTQTAVTVVLALACIAMTPRPPARSATAAAPLPA